MISPKKLRKKYPQFIYQDYFYWISNNDLEIFFDFRACPELGRRISFKPKVVIKNIKKSRLKKIKIEVLDNLIFNLGLVELISYWKATCSPKIEIEAGFLNKEQIGWWKDLITNGMGQFFYENKIDFRSPNFLHLQPKLTENSSLPISVGSRTPAIFKRRLENKVLVPVGGGKDSIVTLETLKKAKKNISCFSLNPTNAIKEVMKMAGCKKVIIERKIDPKLLQLNRKSFLNGHTPFSAYLAFLSVLTAVIFDHKYIAFSNERSSNEGNLKYLGKEINHQYSKTFHFEKNFRKYSQKYLAKNVEYFSFLRPLYEIQISKLFSRHKKYFSVFLSCNEAHKTASGLRKPTGKWCGKCPKCLFIFASLYPFVEAKKLITIFGQNLFDKKGLLALMKELMGLKKFKPFECVGTKKESQVAFYLSWKKAIRARAPGKLPYLLRYFEKNILPKNRNLERESVKIMNSWSSQHKIPKGFKSLPLLTQ